MFRKMNKLVDNRDKVVDDMIQGILRAYPQSFRMAGTSGRAIAVHQKKEGKVGIVIGGGSGHEPAFIGYVGAGLTDGVALGNVFASPAPQPIYDAAKAVESGAGILLIYGNYMGDCMNFEMAADMLESDGIAVRRVIVNDDVASAPRSERDRRRGIAGEVLIYKLAGALAAEGASLEKLAEETQSAVDNTFSIGAAWSPCTLPETGLQSFEIEPHQMELGLGVHGEPGIKRVDMMTAHALAETFSKLLLPELSLPIGRIALFVDGLGATSLMEQYIFYGKMHDIMVNHGACVAESLVGNFITSQEMSGLSVTVMQVNDLREKALRAPSDGMGWVRHTDLCNVMRSGGSQ